MRPIALGPSRATWSTVLMNCYPSVMLNLQQQMLWFLHRLGLPDGFDIYIISTQYIDRTRPQYSGVILSNV
jgi:hypothetical protein